MNSNATIYFSRLLGAKLVSDKGEAAGRLRDLVVDVGGQRPRPQVVAAAIKGPDGERLVDLRSCRVHREGGRYYLSVAELRDAVLPAENLLFIKKHLLDKQIVDVDGRKLVRVNDLVLDSGGSSGSSRSPCRAS